MSGLRILQTNLRRKRVCHDLALATANSREADILVVGDPNQKITAKRGWFRDLKGNVARRFTNNKIKVTSLTPREGYIVVELERFKFFCAYFSPNISIRSYEEAVRKLMDECAACTSSYLLCGDFNAKSHLWGSPTMDERGAIAAEWIATLNLAILNTGDAPTFTRGASRSFIDVTFATQDLVPLAGN